MPSDLLTARLDSLDDDDLKSLIVGGLRLRESRVNGLTHTELVGLCDRELRSAAGFEERARKWWGKLSDKKRAGFVDGINVVLSGGKEGTLVAKEGAVPLIKRQAVESLIQTGLVTGLSKVAAGGLLGVAGVSLVGQMGWLILVQTVGWMAGIKIAVFGVGGYGAFGGAVTATGVTAIGAVVALPGLVLLVDGPAYRKTVPTTIMLLAKTRLDNLTG